MGVYSNSAICHALDITESYVGVNWDDNGDGGAQIPCGIIVYTDKSCRNPAVGSWQRSNGSCLHAEAHGGTFRGVMLDPCHDHDG